MKKPSNVKILITTPDYSIHGGIRVIFEWCNWLSMYHEILLYPIRPVIGRPSWFELRDKVRVLPNNADFSKEKIDLVVFTSPHAVGLFHLFSRSKKVVFMQMAEHLFKPNDNQWEAKCRKFYTTNFPLICISRWNANMLIRMYHRESKIYTVGNGINLHDFPLDTSRKDGKTILVEGWNSLNATKDTKQIGQRVARRLSEKGYRITAFSQTGYNDATSLFMPNEYVATPSLKRMNEMYEKATILIKATQCDARSLSPLEAMTKGTVTARAINAGDDDLIHNENCLRCEYDEEKLFNNAMALLTQEDLRERLSKNCIQYAIDHRWENEILTINNILCRV